jgi:hypothetical protein
MQLAVDHLKGTERTTRRNIPKDIFMYDLKFSRRDYEELCLLGCYDVRLL